MLKVSLVAFLIAASATVGLAGEDGKIHQPKITPQTSGTAQLLIAVSPVNSQVVWAAGTGGTYVVTTNGGKTWKAAVVPGADALQFRDVYGVSDKIAYLLSIGDNTGDFKIYKTIDGGKNWKIEFTNQTENAFYDCFAFWSPFRGVAHSDSVNGVFPDLRTNNGINWQSISAKMPPALAGEASFAASGTCATTQGITNAWIATGGSTTARILATRDGGNSWNAYNTPLVSSPSAGAISVAFRDSRHGIVGGGDLASNDSADTALSFDGGQTWTLTNKPPVQGAIFCLAYVRGSHFDDNGHPGQDHPGNAGRGGDDDFEFEHAVVITAETAPDFSSGPAAWTPDEGRTWFTIPGVSGNWAVGFANPNAGWFVGNNGQILKISF
ncbi:MAG: WD40/YVTN/BNR-like repeat-containing protein [Candidatus Acidiferrales bacterium]